MPVVALITSIFVGYVAKPQVVIDEVEHSGRFKAKKLYVFLIKYVVPICMAVILISSLLGIV